MKYRLRDIRLERKLTQEELASSSGVSRATIIRIESGEEVEVKINTLAALARSLECNISDFLCA